MESKPSTTTGTHLPVMEAFYTLQGEGKFAGHAAYFIRLGGCDVGCVWCDVKESWNASLWPVLSIEKIVSDALVFPARLVVITGGEPLIYPMSPLTTLLKKKDFPYTWKLPERIPFLGILIGFVFHPRNLRSQTLPFTP